MIEKYLTNFLAGGTLGVIGSIGSGVLNYLKTKEENKHEIDKLNAQKELATIAANNAVNLESLKAFSNSYEHDRATYYNENAPKILVFVDFLRGIIRPVITIYLTILASYIAYSSLRETEMSLEILEKIAQYSVYTCLELSGMCIGWYFGSRSMNNKVR